MVKVIGCAEDGAEIEFRAEVVEVTLRYGSGAPLASRRPRPATIDDFKAAGWVPAELHKLERAGRVNTEKAYCETVMKVRELRERVMDLEAEVAQLKAKHQCGHMEDTP